MDLFAENNLLKFNLARSILLKSNVAVPDFSSSSKIIKHLSKFTNIVVDDKFISSFVIGDLLKAAANSQNKIFFIVPSSALDIWKSTLDKQKCRAGAISVRCEFDGEANEFNKASSKNPFDNLIVSEGYQSCSIESLLESFIFKNLGNIVASLLALMHSYTSRMLMAASLITSGSISNHLLSCITSLRRETVFLRFLSSFTDALSCLLLVVLWLSKKILLMPFWAHQLSL